jgi:hypothetical protein
LLATHTYGDTERLCLIGGGAESIPREISRWITALARRRYPDVSDFFGAPTPAQYVKKRDEELYQEAGFLPDEVDWHNSIDRSSRQLGNFDHSRIYFGSLVDGIDEFIGSVSCEIGALDWVPIRDIPTIDNVHYPALEAANYILELQSLLRA